MPTQSPRRLLLVNLLQKWFPNFPGFPLVAALRRKKNPTIFLLPGIGVCCLWWSGYCHMTTFHFQFRAKGTQIWPCKHLLNCRFCLWGCIEQLDRQSWPQFTANCGEPDKNQSRMVNGGFFNPLSRIYHPDWSQPLLLLHFQTGCCNWRYRTL